MWHGCGMELDSLVCSCSSVLCAAPLGCAVLHRETRSAPMSLGLRPHSHLGHREKECADLMMYRKSEEPHRDPRAAIGRHCASGKPSPLWTWASYKRHVETHYVDPLRISLHWDMFCTARLSVVPPLQSPLQRWRRSQRGKTENRRVETECEELYPLKADGKLDGGMKGLSTEADCHKWLQLLARPWSWLQ